MPFVPPRRKRALVCLSTTLSLLLLALAAWALPRAFRLHQPVQIRQLEAPAADFLSQVCPDSHLEVVQEFPLHLVVTADADPTSLERLRSALQGLYHLEEAGGEQLLVVPGRPPFYWVDHRALAEGVGVTGFLLLLPALLSGLRLAQDNWHNRPRKFPPARGKLPSTRPGRRRIYSCPVCDEVFIDEESLGRHQQTHGRRPLRLGKPKSARVLLFLTLALLTGTTSFAVANFIQRWQPEPSLAQWLQEDLSALVDTRMVVAVLEREGQISALVAVDPALQPLVRDRADALGLDPDRVFCLPLGPEPIPTWPLAGLVLLGLLGAARYGRKRTLVVAPPPPAAPAQKPPLSVRELMRVDEMAVEIGRGLLCLVDLKQGNKLGERVTSIRRHIALELGIQVPSIRFRDNLTLKPNQYLICVRGNEVTQGEVQVHQFLAIGPEEKLKNLRGTKTIDPTYGMPGVWIAPELRGEAERLGCMIFDPVSVIATQITEVVRVFSPELLTFQAAVERFNEGCLAAVLAALEQRGIDRVRLWLTLRSLLQERVGIVDLQRICDGLLAASHLNLDDAGLLDYARRALGPNITQEYLNAEGVLRCWLVPSELQQDVLAGRNLEALRKQVDEMLEKFACRRLQPVLVCEPACRRRLFQLFPKLVVLSTAEIHPIVQIDSLSE